MAKVQEFNDAARKNGADGLLLGSLQVDEYSESGYVKKGRFTMTAVRFTDEPKVDRRSEIQFREALLRKKQLHRMEGIWLDPITRERTAILESDDRPGEFVGVQFDPAGSPDVPAGLVTLHLFQKPDGAISGRVTRDDYVEFNVRASVSSAGPLSLRSYQCTNWFTPAELSEKVVPIYEAIEFKFERMPLGDGRGSK
jgi:hypothetical protein